MNKTISIHLQGVPFLIEEDAYQLLNAYIDRLTSILKQSEGAQDIIQDVELRIAELLTKKMENGRKVVEKHQVEEVLEILGSPEIFAEDFEENGTNSTIEVPIEKRLFRDEENAVMGGVCAGVANYLSLDVVFVRAIYVLLTFFAGFGVPLYIILWIITPKARTSYEKLQMKGKAVTLESMKEEVEQAANRIKKETKSWASQVNKNNRLMGNLSKISRVFTVAIGLFLILTGTIFFIVSFIFFLINPDLIPAQMNGEFMSLGDMSKLFMETESDFNIFYLGLVLMAISIIGFFWLAGFRMLFKIRAVFTRYISISLVSTFVISIVLLTWMGADFGRSMAIHGEREKEILVSDSTSIYLNLNRYKSTDKDGFQVTSEGTEGVLKVANGKIYRQGVRISYQQSSDSMFHVKQIIQARGRNHQQALERARNITAKIDAVNNQITLPASFHFPVADKWRDQEWRIVIYVPKNGKVFFKNRRVYPELIEDSEENEISSNGYIHPSGRYDAW